MKREFRRIDAVRKLLARPAASVRVGIGDDCAVVVPGRGDLVITTDALVEGVHFPSGTSQLERLGFRSMAATVSDIASMGARPLWFVVSLALPRSAPDATMTRLGKGMDRAARQYGFDLVGGDTCGSPGPIMLSVTGIGAMAPGVAPLLRTGARAGDVIAVTGTPGDSAAGLAVLQDRLAVSRADRSYLLSRFWSPTPRVEEGVLLATSGACHACIDMSDGLGQDLGHLARGAGLRARIDAASLPRSPAMARHASRDPDQALSWALGGGEDYELIAAIDPAKFDALARRLQRKGLAPLTRIGSFVKGTGVVLQGSGRRIDWTGFSHFGD